MYHDDTKTVNSGSVVSDAAAASDDDYIPRDLTLFSMQRSWLRFCRS